MCGSVCLLPVYIVLTHPICSLSVLPQDDKDLVHEFVIAEGLTCLIKVGAEADQNYQNYILRGIVNIVEGRKRKQKSNTYVIINNSENLTKGFYIFF